MVSSAGFLDGVWFSHQCWQNVGVAPCSSITTAGATTHHCVPPAAAWVVVCVSRLLEMTTWAPVLLPVNLNRNMYLLTGRRSAMMARFASSFFIYCHKPLVGWWFNENGFARAFGGDGYVWMTGGNAPAGPPLCWWHHGLSGDVMGPSFKESFWRMSRKIFLARNR